MRTMKRTLLDGCQQSRINVFTLASSKLNLPYAIRYFDAFDFLSLPSSFFFFFHFSHRQSYLDVTAKLSSGVDPATLFHPPPRIHLTLWRSFRNHRELWIWSESRLTFPVNKRWWEFSVFIKIFERKSSVRFGKLKRNNEEVKGWGRGEERREESKEFSLRNTSEIVEQKVTKKRIRSRELKYKYVTIAKTAVFLPSRIVDTGSRAAIFLAFAPPNYRFPGHEENTWLRVLKFGRDAI